MVILILWFVICDAKTYHGIEFNQLRDDQGTTTETEADSDALDDDLLDRMRRYLTPQTTSLNMREILNQLLARTDNPKLSYHIDEVTSTASKAVPIDVTQYLPEASNDGIFLEYDTQGTNVIDYNTVWPKLIRFKHTNQDYRLNDALDQMPFKVEWLNRTISTTPQTQFSFLYTTSNYKRTDRKQTRISTKRSRSTLSIITRTPSTTIKRNPKGTLGIKRNPSRSRFRRTKNAIRKTYIIKHGTNRNIKKTTTSQKNKRKMKNGPKQMNLIMTRTKKSTKPTRRYPNLIVDIVSEDDLYENSVTEKRKVLPLGVKPSTVPLDFFGFSRGILATLSVPKVVTTVKATDDSPLIIDLLENKRAKPRVFLGLNTTLVFPGYDLVTFDNFKKKGTKVDKIMEKIQAALPQISSKSTETAMEKVVKEKWPALKKWFKEVFPKGLIELVPESMSDILSEKSDDDMSDINVEEVTLNMATPVTEDIDKYTQTLQLIRKDTTTEPPTTIDIIKAWNLHRKLNTDIIGDVNYEYTGTFVHLIDLANSSTSTMSTLFMMPISPGQSMPVYDPPYEVRPLALIPTESSVKQFETPTLGTDVKDKIEVPEGEAMYMDQNNIPSPETSVALLSESTLQPLTEDLVKESSSTERSSTESSLTEISLTTFISLKEMLKKTSETSQISAPDDFSTEILNIDKLLELDGSKYNESVDVSSATNKETRVTAGGLIGLIERMKEKTTTSAIPPSHVDIPALMDMIANLTDGWSGNLLNMLNKSLLSQDIPHYRANKTDESVTNTTVVITTDVAPLTTGTEEQFSFNTEDYDNSTEYVFNITDQFNITEDVFTTNTEHNTFKGVRRINEENTTTSDPFHNITGVLMGKCFVCGLVDPQMPYNAQCSEAFVNDMLPLEPIKFDARKMISKYRKYCRWKNLRSYEIEKSHTMWGRWTGGCSVRWIDLHGMYTQRTCRNRYQPIMGKHYLSKQMAVLELALKHREDACIASPMASLVPLSRGISLYARFHVCVCSGNWCNQASINNQRITFIALVSLLLEYTWMI